MRTPCHHVHNQQKQVVPGELFVPSWKGYVEEEGRIVQREGSQPVETILCSTASAVIPKEPGFFIVPNITVSYALLSPCADLRSISNLNSAIVTISVGPSQRLFAAHEDVLCKSTSFAQQCQRQFFETSGKRIELPMEEPEVFSAVLEYLYKGDYTPKLAYDKKRASWYLEDDDTSTGECTLYQGGVNGAVLKDTIIYVSLSSPSPRMSCLTSHQCAAHRYNLPELQRLALKKQGLQSGVQCSTILSSARFAYANTPASDSKLRAHYLALIIRSRNTFKRSGTM